MIATLRPPPFNIERNINGLSTEERLRLRQKQSAPLLARIMQPTLADVV
jgi:hypothetical protein